MSINVTVSGNPVSIKRGKMITADPHTAKKEFDKRRLLRLEQVRQQSKELAENVRNKVRREKKKQMGDVEKEGKEKLKNWQNRKLLELQNQYLDALDEIGIGHKEAEKLADESEILENQKLQNKEIASSRGKLAETKLQVQKNQENYKKAMPIQHKKLVRDIENTRAELVASMNQRKTKKNNKSKATKADINISIPNDSDFSEASSSDSSKHLPSIREEDSQHSEGFCECVESSEDDHNLLDSCGEEAEPDPRPFPGMVDQSRSSASKQKSYKETIEDRRRLIEDFRSRSRQAPLDTRISDRIKRRQLMAAQPDYCDVIADPTPVSEVEESTRIRDKISSRCDVPAKDPLELSSEECICTKFHSCCPCKAKSTGASKSAAVQTDLVGGYKKTCKCRPKDKPFSTTTREPNKKIGADEAVQSQKVTRTTTAEIPTKPPVRVTGPSGSMDATEGTSRVPDKQIGITSTSMATAEIPTKPHVRVTAPSGSTTATATAGTSRVRHYDYPNRFERDVPSTSHVEKIGADSIEVMPNMTSEAEWHEKMRQRDMDAQVRGKRALEKKKIQKDYEEMMKKLPILQRKEHIAQIGTDKPEYHMSEERLKERERERQNRLENAYAKAIPDLKPQIVTIPSRKHEIPNRDEPFEILDGDDSRTLNLGKWDTETKPKTMFSAEEVQEIIKAFTVQKPEDRKAKLKQLLKSLKLQKEQLINEIRALPKDDSINALISDLTSFSDGDERHRSSKHKGKEKSDRKRRLEESDSSSTSGERKSKSKSRHKEKYGRSPYKKMRKPHHKVLVLQNTSTQTTPKATKEKSSTATTSTTSSSTQVANDALPDGIKICTKSHVPCNCFKGQEGESSEEVCKIFIKLNEEESPKVEVVRSARDSSGRGDETGEGSRKKEGSTEPTSKSPKKQKERISKSPEKDRHSKSPGKENRSPRQRPKRVETKSVATETEVLRQPSSKESKRVRSDTQGGVDRRKSPVRSKDESWKQHLSKNSMSTSSTSYLSPPDFSKPNTTGSTEASKRSLYNLRRKPQQTNIDRSSTLKSSSRSTPDRYLGEDRRLLNYVKRLLGMSKTCVDELGVSSSDVQTPSQSVIDIESNNPLVTLSNILTMMNVRAGDLVKELSGEDDPTVPPNSFVNVSDEPREGEDAPEQPERDTGDKTKESLLCQYAEVTDSCAKRIANLAAMIEQLREEKIQMLKSPPLIQKPTSDHNADPQPTNLQLLTPTFSDVDNSTRYFEFPPSGEGRSRGTSSTASMEEEELNRRLLEIDMSLAEKLKGFRTAKERSADSVDRPGHSLTTVPDQRQDPCPPARDGQQDQTDEQFLERLQRLIEEDHEREQLQPESPLPAVNLEVPFVPFLVDIPKLPILEPEPEGSNIAQERRHPPPSKGLLTAKKFNGNISLVPHELSTIIEADSQVSTRISPNNSRTCVKDIVQQPLSPTLEEHSSPIDDKKSSIKIVNSSDSITRCDERTCPSIALSSTISSKHSSSSSCDMKSIEDMLKSIGMDWAIPTLHKTQEALALTSSSSSGDLSSTKKSGRRSASTSEVSLKDFLKKQMISKISSSSLNCSKESPASFVKECSELSAIQANSSTEKAKQRTSTPVLSSKSTSKSKEDHHQLFTGASDISSVRDSSSCKGSCRKSSGKETFQSLAGEQSSSLTKSSVE